MNLRCLFGFHKDQTHTTPHPQGTMRYEKCERCNRIGWGTVYWNEEYKLEPMVCIPPLVKKQLELIEECMLPQNLPLNPWAK